MHTTQTDLLQAVRDSQNREAWGRFYRIYAPMLRHFARRMGLPESEAEDVSQEVLIVAHRALQNDAYDPTRGSFRPYLYGIARRQTLAALRARHRRTRVQSPGTPDDVDLLNQLEDPHADAAAQAVWEQEWRYAVLDEALRQIRPDVGESAYQAFMAYAVGGRPVDEVAQQLGLAPASVYVYKGRVLDAIRQWIARFENP